MWSQPLSGLPFEVYARQAGLQRVDRRDWAAQAFHARTTRLAAVALLAAVAARLLTRRPRWYPRLLGLGAVLFVPGLWLVVAAWR